MEIGFSSTTYNVIEGASATVTVTVVSGTPDRDITVSLSTVSGTATGKRKTVQCRVYSHNHEVIIPCCYLLGVHRHSMPVASIPIGRLLNKGLC